MAGTTTVHRIVAISGLANLLKVSAYRNSIESSLGMQAGEPYQYAVPRLWICHPTALSHEVGVTNCHYAQPWQPHHICMNNKQGLPYFLANCASNSATLAFSAATSASNAASLLLAGAAGGAGGG